MNQMIFTPPQVRLLKRFLFLVLIYSFIRVGFYFYHYDIYQHFSLQNVFISFLLGLRFDIAAIFLINLLPLFLSLITIENPIFLKFERILFVVICMLTFGISFTDYELFLFMGKRLSIDIFAVTGDIFEQFPQIALYYWYFPLSAIALGMSLYHFDKKFISLQPRKVSSLRQIAAGILLLSIAFVGVRGGFQHKSINVQTAFVQGKNELGHLVLNSPYHFLRTLKNQRIQKLGYFSEDEEAKRIVMASRNLLPGFSEPKKFNFVLIILESFSLEYLEQGYTPFLSSLIKDSIYSDRHLANGRRSIEVLPSLLCGLPSLIDDPISKSAFASNKFICAPHILKEAGYTNYFFHGGSLGTMGFENYTKSSGFDRYFSKDDYGVQDFDGTWGIFDEPFLTFSAEKITNMNEPFFAGIFTLSSHQPYSVPESFKGRFNKGTLEIHESIGYTDFSLKRFFEAAKKKSWFKNTIFIITADHTQKLGSDKFRNLIGHYRVPLLIYSPRHKFTHHSKITQHSDIPKTILDLAGLDQTRLPLTGESVFTQGRGYAVNFADGRTYFLIKDNHVQTLDTEGLARTHFYDWEKGELKLSEDQEQPKLLKAYLQYFINGLVKNNLSP
jgi:phosphoglycerol transferase MdoB-like AlkP superfamily enzyme